MANYIFIKNECEKDEDVQGSYQIHALGIVDKDKKFSLSAWYSNSSSVGSYMTEGKLAISVKGEPEYSVFLDGKSCEINYEEDPTEESFRMFADVLEKIKNAKSDDLIVNANLDAVIFGMMPDDLDEDQYEQMVKEIPCNTTGDFKFEAYYDQDHDFGVVEKQNVKISIYAE